MRYGKDVEFFYRRRYNHPSFGEMIGDDWSIKDAGLGHTILPTGGEVTCRLYWDGEIYASGYARCSKLDNFNYRIGREMAYGRALKAAKEKLKAESERESYDDERTYVAVGRKLRFDGETGCWVEQRPGGRTIYPAVPSRA